MRLNYYLAATLLTLFFCTQNLQAQNQFLIKSIEYDVPIVNKDLCQGSELSETDWWKRNIETSKRCYFQHALLNKAIDGTIKVYDDKENELSIAAITKLISYSDTVRLARNKPPYSFYDTIYTKYISPSEITSIRFRETWYYDPLSYKITKEINSYSPLIAVEQTVKYQNKTKTISKDTPLFWIKCSNNYHDKTYLTLTDYIQYNCPIYFNMPIEMAQFGNLLNVSSDSLARTTYIRMIIFSALSENTKVYYSSDFSDYYDFRIDSLKTMPIKELFEIIGPDTTWVVKPNPPYDEFDSVTYKNVDIFDLSMFRFYEKWLIDPETMEMQKVVMALSPCEEVKSVTGEFKGVKPLFTVMFEKPIRCFGE
jgi:hypothetical protein